MFGLIVFGLLGIYLVVLIGATRVGYRIAAEAGASRPKRILAAAAGFLVIYLPVFWDHIPTIAMHHYYCEKEAGFWVYKTLEQWKKENPGAVETLVIEKGASSARQGNMQNYTDTYSLNQRFNWVVKQNGQFFLNRWKHEQEIIDTNNGVVLARYIDFSTSQIQRQAGWSGWKMWLDSMHCSNGVIDEGKMGQFMLNAKNLSRENK